MITYKGKTLKGKWKIKITSRNIIQLMFFFMIVL